MVMATKECENDEVTEHIKIISNGLFDYLYKTQDCVEGMRLRQMPNQISYI